jgi:flagellar hook-associated protein 3 FlgL
MRVTTNLIFDQNLRAINNSQGELSDLQSQLASGKRLLRPSDDPVGAAQVIRLTEELDKITQYERNIDLATGSLELQETSLRSITDVMNRARVLTVQAGNGIFSQPDREAVAVELEQIRNQVVDLMNTQNASGDYIFSGYQSQKQAFVYNPANNNDPIKFQGDDGTNRMQISDSVSIQTSSSGKSIFENVNGRLNFELSGSNGATLGGYGIRYQGSFDSFHQNNYDPINPVNNQYEFTISGANQVSVTNVGSGTIVDTLPYAADQNMTFNGFEFSLNGAVGDSVTLELKQPEKVNIAETIHNMALALKNPSMSSQEFLSAIDDTLVGLDNGLDQMARENSSIGARLNIAQSVKSSLLDTEVTTQQARSAIQDVDYAEASTDFARQETALEAAFASFPRIANLSLFNFI